MYHDETILEQDLLEQDQSRLQQLLPELEQQFERLKIFLQDASF